jgi:ATP-dependent exoDNAse (exonuclease V) beta subunit
MKKGNLTNYLWCSPTTKPFNQLSILPVEYGKRLENSIFEREYFDEKMHRYIDNLNLAYVAFTRAKNRLICFTEKVKIPENISKINSVAQLLMWIFADGSFPVIEKPEILTKHFDAEQFIFEFGEKTPITSVEQPNATNEITNLQAEPQQTFRDKPEIKIRKTKIISGVESEFNQPRKLGIVMHAVLGKIQIRSDQENALKKCINEGIFSIAQKKEVLNELEKFWSIPQTAEWFANDVKVLNETTILTPSGEMYRPDRVVIKANNVIVVDYKFGEYEKYSYERQVKEYMKLLQEMEYNTKGYIYYVNLGKVVEVI